MPVEFHERRSVRSSDDVVAHLIRLEHALGIKLKLLQQRFPGGSFDELEHELSRLRQCLYMED